MSRLALLDNDKSSICSHDASVMSHWHDDDRKISIQPMVICFSWEKQVSVAPKDVYRPSIFFFPHNYPLCWWSINLLQFIFYHSRSTDFGEKIEGLWIAQQANIFNNYAFKRYVWFSLHHFALWLSHRIFCICLRNCWWLVIIAGGWAICIGCFMYFDQIITDRRISHEYGICS